MDVAGAKEKPQKRRVEGLGECDSYPSRSAKMPKSLQAGSVVVVTLTHSSQTRVFFVVEIEFKV